MKVRHHTKALPRRARAFVSKDQFMAACDMPFIHGPKGLFVKLILVKNRSYLGTLSKKMNRLTGHCVDGCKRASAFVKPMWHQSGKFSPGKSDQWTMLVDPRYAAVVCFAADDLNIEIVAHECVHAGLAWARRWKGTPELSVESGDDEEDLCYPTGYLTRRVLEWLKEEGHQVLK